MFILVDYENFIVPHFLIRFVILYDLSRAAESKHSPSEVGKCSVDCFFVILLAGDKVYNVAVLIGGNSTSSLRAVSPSFEFDEASSSWS